MLSKEGHKQRDLALQTGDWIQGFDKKITVAKFKEVDKKYFLIHDGIDKSGRVF
jgi:hypothetical protein